MPDRTWEFYRVSSDGAEYAVHHGYGTEAEAKRHCATIDSQAVLPGLQYRPGGHGGCDLSGAFAMQRVS